MAKYFGDIRPYGWNQGDLVEMLYQTMYYTVNTVGATPATYFTVAVQNNAGSWTGLTSAERRITPNGFAQADVVQALYEIIYALITVPIGAGYTEADHTGRVARRILASTGTPSYTGGTTTRNFIIERNGWNMGDVCQILYEILEAMIDDCSVATTTWTKDVEDKTQHLAGVSG